LQEGYYTPPDKVSGNKHFRRLVLRTLGRRFVHLRRVGITDRRKDKKSLVRARTWKFDLGWLIFLKRMVLQYLQAYILCVVIQLSLLSYAT
jgi:hypothetical protein